MKQFKLDSIRLVWATRPVLPSSLLVIAMPDVDFSTEILTDEVVVGHRGDGHIFRFPVLANGTVSLHGSQIEPNPKAKHEARRYLAEAYSAAKAALGSRAG